MMRIPRIAPRFLSAVLLIVPAFKESDHDERFELLDEMKDLMDRILERPAHPTETTVYHGYGSRGQSRPSSSFVSSNAEGENNTTFIFSDAGEVVFRC